MPRAFEVWEGLFISDGEFAASRAHLQRLGVSLVVNMAENLDDPEFPELNGGLRQVKCGIWDWDPAQMEPEERERTVENVHLAVEEIQRGLATGRVLVHCIAGLSRSPITCMAWLHRHQNMSWDFAERRVVEMHPASAVHNVALRRFLQRRLLPRGKSIM